MDHIELRKDNEFNNKLKLIVYFTTNRSRKYHGGK